MMMVTFISLAVVGVRIFLNNRMDARQVYSLMEGRLTAYQNLHGAAGTPEVVVASSAASVNQVLRQCITGAVCPAVSSANPRRFVAYANYGPTTSRQISGRTPQDSGGFYTSHGVHQACAPGPNCPFFGQTWFWVECPGNVPCSFPDKFHIRSQIAIIPGALPIGSMQVSAYPPNAQLQSHETVLSLDDLRNQPQMCPMGAYASGLTAAGNLICACAQGFQNAGIDSTGNIRCIAISKGCPNAGDMMVGIKADGTAICTAQTQPHDNCGATLHLTNTGNGTCPNATPPWHMRMILFSKECTTKANGDVQCDMDIKCCQTL